MSRRFAFARAIDSPWLAMEPVRIGHVGRGSGTPSEYLLVDRDGQPELCIHLHRDSEDFMGSSAAIELDTGVIAVGFARSVHAVDTDSCAVRGHDLPSPFRSFHRIGQQVLAACDSGLLCLRPDGRLEWQSPRLAIEGVRITDVKHDVLSGLGNWDPPHGWRPFQLDLATGKVS